MTYLEKKQCRYALWAYVQFIVPFLTWAYVTKATFTIGGSGIGYKLISLAFALSTFGVIVATICLISLVRKLLCLKDECKECCEFCGYGYPEKWTTAQCPECGVFRRMVSNQLALDLCDYISISIMLMSMPVILFSITAIETIASLLIALASLWMVIVAIIITNMASNYINNNHLFGCNK